MVPIDVSKETLNRQLELLQEELESADSLDAETRESLTRLAGDIGRVLNDEAANPESVAKRVEQAALRFEASHPNLARVFGEVTDALAKLGI